MSTIWEAPVREPATSGAERPTGDAGVGDPAYDVPARHILVVEDVPQLAEMLGRQLRQIARDVSLCGDGRAALELARRTPPDLLVLDIGLPTMSGLDLCRALRAGGSTTPILMLSGRGSELDRIVGLEFGADDYLVKPFSMLELLARAKAILRRAEMRAGALPMPAAWGERLSVGPLVIDPAAREVLHDQRAVALTEKEFDLLYLLASNPGRVYSRYQLLDLVWGCGSNVYEYTVTSHISRLRSKIEFDPERPDIIQTVWGVGYRVRPHGA